MKPLKLLNALLFAALLFPGTARYSLGQDQKKKEQNRKERELMAGCKSELKKNEVPLEPKNWKLEKGEKYGGGPVISYTIEEDGTVTSVKLKRSSGVQRIDEYYLARVKDRKFEVIPGCPVVEATLDVLIHFQ